MEVKLDSKVLRVDTGMDHNERLTHLCDLQPASCMDHHEGLTHLCVLQAGTACRKLSMRMLVYCRTEFVLHGKWCRSCARCYAERWRAAVLIVCVQKAGVAEVNLELKVM